MHKGFLAIVLHAHLPYVRHPERDECLEENWFYEAVTETYVPLYMVFSRLAEHGVPYRITISISPPLASMLGDELLRRRYLQRLDNLVELAEREVERTRWQPEFHESAIMYRDRFRRVREVYRGELRTNLLDGFKSLADAGRLELITSAATHGYLPLMDVCPEAARAQILTAVDFHKKVFGSPPKGMWLPECGYSPGHDWHLKEAGIRYFFTDSHGITYASPRPRYGVFAPVYTRAGVAAFGRDMESSKQVWSAMEGYPGDFDYREFYRDIGYELDIGYLRPYMCPSDIRHQTGIKYYRVTCRGEHKEPYVRAWAIEKAAVHAGNFVFNRQRQVEYLAGVMDRAPIVVAPYDAELFGHWWFEGPEFIDFLIRKIAYDQDTIKLVTPSDYLEVYPRNQVSTPSMSSWGYGGYSEVWLADANQWIYRHLHAAAWRMTELARRYPPPQPELTHRALTQAARELLLAQSSDWAFIMKTGTCADYAVQRTKAHISRFLRLSEDIQSGTVDSAWLCRVESQDNIFPDLDYSIWAGRPAQRQETWAAAGA
ncbi:MAG: DUF1957 domain-containing protein [Firmicutes bacterium]|jgi:1,4-alpha-glucan branching enzyme|nr:DUF1957 domain-containing protein [Bacillota bacterium]